MEDITPVSERVLDWKPKTAVSLRNYLKRWVWISYAAYVLSALLVVLSLFALGVYAAGRWTFYNPPYGHSVVLFHIGHALIILIVFSLWLWPKVRRPQSMTQVAARIERGDRKNLSKRTGDEDPLEFILEGRDERLASGVTSALEFSNPDPLLEQCLIPSRNLLAGSGRTSETIGLFERVLTDLQKRPVWKWVVPMTFWVSIGIAGIVGVGATFLDRIEPFTWQDAWKFYQSHFLVDPYRPQHELVVNPGSNQTVLRGESLKVWGILIGPGTHQATITYNMVGFPEQTVEMKNNGPPNSFVFEFENLQSDLTYRVKSGPLESPQYEAKVRIPPELTSIRLTYFYPEFMKKNFEVMPAGQGAAIAPMGTTVEITTRWNQPMDSVSIIVNGEQPIPMTPGGTTTRGGFNSPAQGPTSFPAPARKGSGQGPISNSRFRRWSICRPKSSGFSLWRTSISPPRKNAISASRFDSPPGTISAFTASFCMPALPADPRPLTRSPASTAWSASIPGNTFWTSVPTRTLPSAVCFSCRSTITPASRVEPSPRCAGSTFSLPELFPRRRMTVARTLWRATLTS